MNMKNLKYTVEKEKVNKIRYICELIICIILSPLIFLSIIVFKSCDGIVWLYKKLIKKENDKSERD